MPALPPNFVDVTTARSKSCRVNVTGVVVDVLPKKQTHGSSALTTFTIMDSSFQVGYRDGLKVKYFNDDLNFLPDVQVGDVIQLDDIRVCLSVAFALRALLPRLLHVLAELMMLCR